MVLSVALAGVVVAAAGVDGCVMPMETPRGRPMQAYERLWRLVDAAVARELAIREAILALVCEFVRSTTTERRNQKSVRRRRVGMRQNTKYSIQNVLIHVL